MNKKLFYIFVSTFFTLSINAQILFSEDFETAEGATPPNGWTQEVLSGGPADRGWRFDDPDGITENGFYGYSLQGQFAIFDNWFYQNSEPDEFNKDVVLISPELDFSAETDYLFVFFKQVIQDGQETRTSVEVFNGSEWIEVHRRNSGETKYPQARFEITEQARGVSNARIRFRFQDTHNTFNDFGLWAIDNLEISRNAGLDLDATASNAYNAIECWGQEADLSITLVNTGYLPIDFSVHPLLLTATVHNEEVEELHYERIVTEGSLAIGEEKEFLVTSYAEFPEYGQTFYTVEGSVQGEFDPRNNKKLDKIRKKGPSYSPTIVAFGIPNSNNSTNTDFAWRRAIGTPGDWVINQEHPQAWKLVDYFVNNPEHEYPQSMVLEMGNEPVNSSLVCHPIFVSEVSSLVFETAMTQTGSTASATWGSDDFLKVLVSADCGESFEEIGLFDQNSSIGNEARKHIFSLRDYADQEIQVALYASNGTQTDETEVELFLTNLSIQERPIWDTSIGRVDATAIFCNEVGGTVWVEVLNSGTGTLPLALNALELNLKVYYGSNQQYFNAMIEEGILTANGSTWLGIPLTDLQPFTAGHCFVELNMSLTEEQNESNNFREWTQALRKAVEPLPYVVDFKEYYDHLPLGNAYPRWWEGVGAEKPLEEDSKWRSSLNSEGRARLDFEEGEEIEEWIVSPVFVPENDTELRFNFFINGWPEQSLGNDDVFEILISTDCKNFEPLRVYDSDYVHPIGRVEDVYDLSAYKGQEVMIGFHGSSNGVADKYAIVVLHDVYIGPALETNISESSLEEEDFLKVFPNPSKGLFQLDLPSMGFETEWEIVVRDLQGKEVYLQRSTDITNSQNNSEAQIDLKDVASGVYVLQWRSGQKVRYQKIVKY